MSIKTKLTLGIGLLFLMILVLSGIGIRYISALKNDTENILIANYNTLEYARNMLMALDEIQQGKNRGFDTFNGNLEKQKRNITEPGEDRATQQISRHFDSLKTRSGDSSLHVLIRKDISDIMGVNMVAIERKSDLAKSTAQKANTGIIIASTLCFLLGITLLLNLPAAVANPIREFTESIREIAAQNYSKRVHYKGRNEFGQLADSFNTMAEKLEEYNNSSLSKLLVEKKRIETLINNMREPVIGLDENKTILFINNEALKISGLTAGETIGKPAVDIAVTNDLIRSLIRDMMPGYTSPSKAAPLKIFADGKESYFEKEIVAITTTPPGENEQRLIGQVIVLKNITPFKELDFAKTNFIATVSHELKTPISSIKMSLQLLKNQNTGPVNTEQSQLIESINEDSDRLLKITGELLNMSQVETGNIQLNIQSSRPDTILRFALEAVKVQAEQKRIVLDVDSDEDLPDVKADTEKTAWVLINFLTNAIRHSQEDSRVRIRITKQENGVVFSVKDDGKGIDSRYRNKIFERYYQVPGSSKSGTGLGLAISKEFIEAQGGQIGVESEIGMGSTFYFHLARS